MGAWVNALAFVPYELVQSQGRPDITAKFHAIELAPFLAILWMFTNAFGLVGAAAAWSLRVIIDGLCLYRASRLPTGALVQTILPVALLAAASLTAQVVGIEPREAVPGAIVVGLVSLTLALTYAIELRSIAKQIIRTRQYRARYNPSACG